MSSPNGHEKGQRLTDGGIHSVQTGSLYRTQVTLLLRNDAATDNNYATETMTAFSPHLFLFYTGKKPHFQIKSKQK